MPPRSQLRDDPGAGSSFRLVDSTGARFPRGSFRAMAWDPASDESYVEGQNLEYPFAHQVVGDEVLLTRGNPQAPVDEGWVFSLLQEVPSYELGRPVTIRGHFAQDQRPYTVTVRDPSGGVTEYGTATGVTATDPTIGVYQFEPQQAGWWGFRWRGSAGELDDAHFYVDRSSVR